MSQNYSVELIVGNLELTFPTISQLKFPTLIVSLLNPVIMEVHHNYLNFFSKSCFCCANFGLLPVIPLISMFLYEYWMVTLLLFAPLLAATNKTHHLASTSPRRSSMQGSTINIISLQYSSNWSPGHTINFVPLLEEKNPYPKTRTKGWNTHKTHHKQKQQKSTN